MTHDGVTDMGSEAFRLLRTIVPEAGEQPDTNSMFIVGDGHQRIYGRRVVLGQCGIKIRGRSRKLRINYRTSEEIRKWALSVLRGVELDGPPKVFRYQMHRHCPHPSVKPLIALSDATSAPSPNYDAHVSATIVHLRLGNQDDVVRHTCFFLNSGDWLLLKAFQVCSKLGPKNHSRHNGN